MHEHHHKETPPTNNGEDLNLSQEVTPVISSDTHTDHAHQLQIWLDLPTAREQRRFLENHFDLLNEHSETILHNLFAQEPADAAQAKQRREMLMLLQDARQRGGTEEAVREAYVNLYGGFVLDLSPWLESVEQRLIALLNQNRPEETAEARVVLLQEALEQMQEDAEYAPELLATLRLELANAWRLHPRTDHTQAIEIDINFCEEVLRCFSVTHYPYQYAKTQRSLGTAYLNSSVREQKENLERAITCYQEALRVYTLDTFPSDYAMVQHNLGNTYSDRIVGERRENLELAIICYQEALRVHTLDAFPFDYARAQNNLGNTYSGRIVGKRKENLELAIICYQEALRVHTLDAFPFDYARAQNNLGNTYSGRIVGKRKENLELAIICYQEALRVHTLDAFPFDYALIQNNLGSAYQDRIVGERKENLELAIIYYQEALRVHTLDAFPFHYAQAQNNLGIVYQDRITEERRENLEYAIVSHQEALRVWTLDAFPFYHARAQNNLGTAYKDRIVGEQRENLEYAITCYHEALRVYTIEVFTRDFRNVHMSLAEIEAQRDNWKGIQDAYTKAIEAEDLLIILGVGILGRDAILKEGHDAALRQGYALHRLGHISEAAVAMERGRARGLAEAMAFDAADPALITNEERRSHYTNVRAALITAQANLNTPLSQDVDENTRRRLDLERTATYRQAKAIFDELISAIREAHDPTDFLDTSLDAVTLLQAVERVAPGHAFVYLAATPWEVLPFPLSVNKDHLQRISPLLTSPI